MGKSAHIRARRRRRARLSGRLAQEHAARREARAVQKDAGQLFWVDAMNNKIQAAKVARALIAQKAIKP